MVEIIGKDQAAMKRATCKECASILQYTESEVKTRQYSACGDIGTISYVDCPNGHECIIRHY